MSKETEPKKQSQLMKLMSNEQFDEVYTPSYAVDPIVPYLPKDKVIWECTDYGASKITTYLRESGYTVISTSKAEFDYLVDTPDFDYDIVVTNPPYSLKDKFLERSYELGKPFALLLPITSLEGIKRSRMYDTNGIEVMVLDRRVNFTGGKSGSWFNTSWFCWQLLPQSLMFKQLEIPKGDK